MLAQARNATNLLFQLLGEVKALAAEADTLKSNDAGRLVALYPDLVAQASRFYETELPAAVASAEVVAKLEGVRRIEVQISEAVGTTFEPGADLRVTAQNSALWAGQQRQKVAQARSFVGSLIRESKIKITGGAVTAISPSLGEAMQRLREAESTARQQLITEKTTEAKSEGNNALAQAEAKRVLDQAKADAARIVDEANEIKAKAERETKLRQAGISLADTKTDIAVQHVLDEATREKLRQRAADPSVQAALAPLITPGLWTPSAGFGPLRLIQKKALSLSEITTAGALNPDSKGLLALIRIACHARNDRPKWNDITVRNQPLTAFLNHPDRVELATERQKILIEVAPVLVEMKLLEP